MKLLPRKRALVIAGDPSIPAEFHSILCPQLDEVDRPEDAVFSGILGGLELDSASQGSDGWSRVQESQNKKSPYYLAIVDRLLPGDWDGVETILRLWGEDPHLPILIFDSTGFTDASRRDILCRLGNPDRFLFLNDPRNIEHFRQLAANLISRRRSQAESSNRIARLHSEIDRARSEATAAMQARGELFDNISHELRTPMNAILGFSSLMLSESLTEDQLEKMRYVHQAGMSLMGVIDKMLDFAKLSSGRMRLKKTPFDLEEVLCELVAVFRPQAMKKGVYLEHHITTSVPRWVRADKHRFRQILVNLLENAVKFTDQGSIHIQATLDEETPTYALLRFTVNDSGVGIPAERQEAMFQSFMQADSSLSRKYGGLGLGLAIGKQLADLMGGQIGFRSTPGQGSSFWLTIGFAKYRPTEKDLHRSALEHSSRQEPQRGPRRIIHGRPYVLVADVERLNRTSVEMLLSQIGCVVDQVGSCDELYATIRKSHYNLVLLDVDMAGLQAAEMIQELRTIQEMDGRHLPIIAMSVQMNPDDRQRWIAAGADEAITRPCDPEILVGLACRHLPSCMQIANWSKPPEKQPDQNPATRRQYTSDDYLEDIREGLATKDYFQMEAAAGGMKEILASEGKQQAADEAMRVQLASRSRDFEKATFAVEKLQYALTKIDNGMMPSLSCE